MESRLPIIKDSATVDNHDVPFENNNSKHICKKMECIYNPTDDNGYVLISNLDYSSIVAGAYVNPAVWFKYLHITRNWIFEEKHQLRSETENLRTRNFKVEFGPAVRNLFQLSDDHYKDYLGLMNHSFRYDCVVKNDNGESADFDFVITELKTGNHIARAVSSAIVVGSKSSSIHQIKKSGAKNNLECYTSRFHVPRYETTETSCALVCLFISMCHNCADEAIQKSILSFLTGSLCKYYPNTIEVQLYDFHLTKDQIDVSMWTGENNSKTLHFQLEQNGIVLANISMDYVKWPSAGL
uniref:Low-density lipoprotein receptor-related protein 4-like n=1 Tax=Phallusia mammillata TaxID=59560 RepID=A0A6F9DKR7_9ASCI|nr:low-density lipoprotein receptor-related protein 4-like [Phallusia mammillata]